MSGRRGTIGPVGRRSTDARIREMALHISRVSFVDCYDISTRDGQAGQEPFVADQLHSNADGDELLTDRGRPHLTTKK